MPNVLADGLASLTADLKEFASETVTYRRGVNSVSVQAMIGSRLLRTTNNAGQTKTERTDLTLWIKAADLIISSSVVTPLAHDYVDLTIGGVIERFEVLPIGSEPAWRYSDPHKTQLEIHTKRRGTV